MTAVSVGRRSRTSWRQVWWLLRPQRGRLAVALLVGLASSLASLAQPLVLGGLVGVIGRGERVRVVQPALLAVLFVTEALSALAFGWLVGTAGNNAVRSLRHELVGKVLRAPLSVLRSQRQGDILTRVVGDTSALRNSLAQSISTLVLSTLGALGIIALMTYLDAVLSVAVLVCASLTVVGVVMLARRLRGAALRARDRDGDVGAALTRALGAISTVKLSNAEEREVTTLGLAVNHSHRAAAAAVRLGALIGPAANSGLQIAFAAVFVIGAVRLKAGTLQFGEFAAFLLYLFYLIAPLLAAATSLAQVQLGLAAVERVNGLLAMEDERGAIDTDRSGTGRENAGHPSLCIKDLHFNYPGGPPVLRGLSLEIVGPGLTAIVGPSGAGKSTLLRAISRLWVSDPGRIFLNGTDIQQLPLPELRSRIAMVEQDAAVLDGTVGENIRYAMPTASVQAVDFAVDLAGLREWVDGLSCGLDTPVGETGSAASGGQRQRIALARIFLMSPEVLMLDEVTSQQDGRTEATLRRALRHRATTQAVVVVAHRLSTAVEADRIVVLDDGRVRASGQHADLLARDDLYAELVRTQLLPPSRRPQPSTVV